jgi:hypothetical protein
MRIFLLVVIAISITFPSADHGVYDGSTLFPIPSVDHWGEVGFFGNMTQPHGESLRWIIDPWKGLSDPPLLGHTVPFLLFAQKKGELTIHSHTILLF